MMKDKELKKLIRKIDTEAVVPEGIKEKFLDGVMSMKIKAQPDLSPFERFFFEKPLRTACMIAIPVSGSLWAIMGSNFVKLLTGILG